MADLIEKRRNFPLEHLYEVDFEENENPKVHFEARNYGSESFIANRLTLSPSIINPDLS